MACVVSAAKLEGYADGGDTGLGVSLDDGGAGVSGVGGGSVLPFVLIGSGVIPESAFVSVTGGVAGEVPPGAPEDFDDSVPGELPGEGVEEEYLPVDVLPAPGKEYLAPQN